MGKTVNGANQYLGKGEVWFDEFDTNGARTGEQFLGNVEDFNIAMSVETSKRYSSAEASAPLVSEAVKRTSGDITAVCDEWTADNIARFLRGTKGTLSQGSGSFTSGSPDTIVAKLDRYVPLQKRSVSAFVLKDSAQTTTYVLGTDYDVDTVLGRVYFIEGGAITANQSVKAEYSYAVVSIPQIAVGQTPQRKGYLRFIGKPSAGPAWDAELWIVQLGGDGSLNMISEDHGTFSLKGSVLADTVGHPTSPLGVWQKRS